MGWVHGRNCKCPACKNPPVEFELLQTVRDWLKLRVHNNVPVSPMALRALQKEIESRLKLQERKNDD